MQLSAENLEDLPSSWFRYETKVPLQRQQYQELIPSFYGMGLHPKKTYPDRLVHSIYLDTPELDDYFDNVSGVSRRRKIRLRWYGEDPSHMVIEVKSKKNKVSGKRIIHLENPENLIPRDRHALKILFEGNIVSSPIDIAPLYRPVLQVAYRRSYFELKPGIRMTLDREIRYQKLSPSVSHQMRLSPVDYVVEFKYSVSQEREFKNLLRDFPFRIFRHSKYIVGMDVVAVG